MKKNRILALLFMSCFCSAVSAQNSKQPLINLSLNENPYGITSSIRKSIESEIYRANRYAADDGQQFVETVAKFEGVKPVQIIPGEILESLGIYLSIRQGTGKDFIYSVPGYPALVNAAASVGGKVVSIPLNSNGENALDKIEASVNDNTAAVYLVNPHNPSGTVSGQKEFHDFLHRIAQKATVIVDEAYLEYDVDFKNKTALNNLKEGDNVIVFRTLAKAYGLAGLSIGYAIAPEGLANFLREKGLGDTHALNRLSIVAGVQSLKDTAQLKKVVALVNAEREKWNALLNTHHIEHTDSKANFVFLNLHIPNTEIRKRFLEKGIVVGRSFAPYDTWVRITIGTPEENKKAQDVVEEMLKGQQ